MSSQGIRQTVAGSSKLLWLVFRHVIVAPLVSFVVSFAALLPGVILVAVLGRPGAIPFYTFVGFCGVMAGASCLPRASCRWGAIGLTLLGLVYYANFVAEWGDVITDEGKTINMHDRSLMQLILLGVGGLLATAVMWWRSLKSPQPKDDGFSSGTLLTPLGQRDF